MSIDNFRVDKEVHLDQDGSFPSQNQAYLRFLLDEILKNQNGHLSNTGSIRCISEFFRERGDEFFLYSRTFRGTLFSEKVKDGALIGSESKLTGSASLICLICPSASFLIAVSKSS